MTPAAPSAHHQQRPELIRITHKRARPCRDLATSWSGGRRRGGTDNDGWLSGVVQAGSDVERGTESGLAGRDGASGNLAAVPPRPRRAVPLSRARLRDRRSPRARPPAPRPPPSSPASRTRPARPPGTGSTTRSMVNVRGRRSRWWAGGHFCLAEDRRPRSRSIKRASQAPASECVAHGNQPGDLIVNRRGSSNVGDAILSRRRGSNADFSNQSRCPAARRSTKVFEIVSKDGEHGERSWQTG